MHFTSLIPSAWTYFPLQTKISCGMQICRYPIVVTDVHTYIHIYVHVSTHRPLRIIASVYIIILTAAEATAKKRQTEWHNSVRIVSKFATNFTNRRFQYITRKWNCASRLRSNWDRRRCCDSTRRSRCSAPRTTARHQCHHRCHCHQVPAVAWWCVLGIHVPQHPYMLFISTSLRLIRL